MDVHVADHLRPGEQVLLHRAGQRIIGRVGVPQRRRGRNRRLALSSRRPSSPAQSRCRPARCSTARPLPARKPPRRPHRRRCRPLPEWRRRPPPPRDSARRRGHGGRWRRAWSPSSSAYGRAWRSWRCPVGEGAAAGRWRAPACKGGTPANEPPTRLSTRLAQGGLAISGGFSGRRFSMRQGLEFSLPRRRAS